jgi:hypothetical protein
VRGSTVVTVATIRGAIAVVAAVVVGGCSGGDERKQVFTAADAVRIANVRPARPGWSWPKNPKKHLSSGGSTTETASTDPLDVELMRETADLASIGAATTTWEDTHKLAHLYTQVYARAASAHKLMAPFNAYSRGWAKRFGGITKDEEVDYLGDEGWLLETDANGPEVTYHWRRANLVVEAHVQCFGLCPADVAAAARAWAEAIDQAARVGS